MRTHREQRARDVAAQTTERSYDGALRPAREAHAPFAGGAHALERLAISRGPVMQRLYNVTDKNGMTHDIDDPALTHASLLGLFKNLGADRDVHHEAFMSRLSRLHSAPSGPLGPTPEHPAEKFAADTIDLAERAEKASRYTKNPLEIKRLATSGETQPLLPKSPELRAWQIGGVKRLGGQMLGGSALGTAASEGVGLVASELGGVVGKAAKGTINTVHTAYQSGKMQQLSTQANDEETRDALHALAVSRGKTSGVQGVSTAASVTTGTLTGAALGTAIPIPVLGTLIGGIVGGLTGLATSKVTETIANKAIGNPENDMEAVQKLHFKARENDPHALAAFKLHGIDEHTAHAHDGWKALASKVGAKAPY